MTNENTTVNTDVENLREQILVRNVTELTNEITPAYCEKLNELYDKPLNWLNESTNNLVNQFLSLYDLKENTILKHEVSEDSLAYGFKINSGLTCLSGYSVVIEHEVVDSRSLSFKELEKYAKSEVYAPVNSKTKFYNYLKRLEKFHVFKIRPITDMHWKVYKLRYINPTQVKLYNGMDKYDWLMDTPWSQKDNRILSFDKYSLPILMFSKKMDKNEIPD